jgi:hypothetical protein
MTPIVEGFFQADFILALGHEKGANDFDSGQLYVIAYNCTHGYKI